MEYNDVPVYEDLIANFIEKFEQNIEFRTLVIDFMFTPVQAYDFKYEGTVEEGVLFDIFDDLWNYDPQALYWNMSNCVMSYWEDNRNSYVDGIVED